jgi:hypothetical protein
VFFLDSSCFFFGNQGIERKEGTDSLNPFKEKVFEKKNLKSRPRAGCVQTLEGEYLGDFEKEKMVK